MTSINSALSSVVQSFAPQQAPLTAKDDKNSEKTATSSVSSADNTKVNLSSAGQVVPVDYSKLATMQTVKQSESIETRTMQRNETTGTDLTYSSNLQLRSNYYQDQIMNSKPPS